MLASRSETLTMGKTESIEEFSGKLSAIASEAHILGKRYKDKKLVKKLLRCLPAKFESKRTAMATALDTDNIEFEEVVGMLQAYEMEITPTYVGNSEGVADENKKDIQELKKDIESLSRKVNMILDSNDMRNRCNLNQGQRKEEEEKLRRRSNTKCHLCQGYGHDKANCPSLKLKEIKCYECGGFGHIKAQCVKVSRKEKPITTESDSDTTVDDSDSDDEDSGMVAFMGNIREVGSSSDSDMSDSDEDSDLDLKEEFRKLHESWLVLVKERKILTSEKLSLITEKENLGKELIAEREESRKIKERLGLELVAEKEKNRGLLAELSDTRKKISMLNSGTKDLESILAGGRVEKSRFGLGYNGGDTTETTKSVKKNAGFYEQNRTAGCSNSSKRVPTEKSDFSYRTSNQYGCYYCGKNGHIKRHCYMFKAKVRRLMSQERYCPHYNDSSYVFMRKDDIYEKDGEACSMDFAKAPNSESFKSKKHEAELQDHGFLNELCQSHRGRLLNGHGSNVSLKFSSGGRNARLSNSIKKGEIVSAREKGNYISADYLFSR